jgi:hypothetical protein
MEPSSKQPKETEQVQRDAARFVKNKPSNSILHLVSVNHLLPANYIFKTDQRFLNLPHRSVIHFVNHENV